MDEIFRLVLVGLLIGLPTTTIAIFGYRRSQKADKVAEASGAVAGWDKLIDNLQQDNVAVRAERDEYRAERDEYRRRLIALGGAVCIVAFIALGAESVKQHDDRLVDKATRVTRIERAADVQQRVDDQIEALGITTTTTANSPAPTTSAPPSPVAVLPTTVPTVTSTITTTTTTTTAPPIVTVPTTITIPITLPTIPLP